ncbi:MAG: hypothetical protein ACO387_03495 [Flavobacteriaceae bacterium]
MTLETNQRKNIALLIMFGGAVVFTIYLLVTLYLLKDDLNAIYWLAVFAHLQLFVILSGFTALLVKRRIEVNTEGVIVNDLIMPTPPSEEEEDPSKEEGEADGDDNHNAYSTSRGNTSSSNHV